MKKLECLFVVLCLGVAIAQAQTPKSDVPLLIAKVFDVESAFKRLALGRLLKSNELNNAIELGCAEPVPDGFADLLTTEVTSRLASIAVGEMQFLAFQGNNWVLVLNCKSQPAAKDLFALSRVVEHFAKRPQIVRSNEEFVEYLSQPIEKSNSVGNQELFAIEGTHYVWFVNKNKVVICSSSSVAASVAQDFERANFLEQAKFDSRRSKVVEAVLGSDGGNEIGRVVCTGAALVDFGIISPKWFEKGELNEIVGMGMRFDSVPQSNKPNGSDLEYEVGVTCVLPMTHPSIGLADALEPRSIKRFPEIPGEIAMVAILGFDYQRLRNFCLSQGLENEPFFAFQPKNPYDSKEHSKMENADAFQTLGSTFGTAYFIDKNERLVSMKVKEIRDRDAHNKAYAQYFEKLEAAFGDQLSFRKSGGSDYLEIVHQSMANSYSFIWFDAWMIYSLSESAHNAMRLTRQSDRSLVDKLMPEWGRVRRRYQHSAEPCFLGALTTRFELVFVQSYLTDLVAKYNSRNQRIDEFDEDELDSDLKRRPTKNSYRRLKGSERVKAANALLCSAMINQFGNSAWVASKESFGYRLSGLFGQTTGVDEEPSR